MPFGSSKVTSLAISGSAAPASLNFVRRSGWPPASLVDEVVSNSAISRLWAEAGPAMARAPRASSPSSSASRWRALAIAPRPLLRPLRLVLLRLVLFRLVLLHAFALALEFALRAVGPVAVAGPSRAADLGRA